MSQIKIGWAEEEFVLTKPVSLQGQFAERISEYIEKPVIKRVYHKQIIRNPLEFAAVGTVCFVIGVIIGLLL